MLYLPKTLVYNLNHDLLVKRVTCSPLAIYYILTIYYYLFKDEKIKEHIYIHPNSLKSLINFHNQHPYIINEYYTLLQHNFLNETGNIIYDKSNIFYNLVNFCEKFEHKFIVKLDNFVQLNNQQIKINFYETANEFMYYKNEDFQSIKIPLMNHNLYIILPHHKRYYYESKNCININELQKSMQIEQIILTIPELKLNNEINISDFVKINKVNIIQKFSLQLENGLLINSKLITTPIIFEAIRSFDYYITNFQNTIIIQGTYSKYQNDNS